MRLIDADKLKYYGNHIGDEYEDRFHDFQYVDRDQIDKAPSIDICFCRECKWFDSGKNDSEIWSMCTRHFGKYIDVNADDFCSYGERENDE